MNRQVISAAGNLPGVLIVLVGPVVGMLYGHLHYPEVLISDLMNLPIYREVFGCALLLTAAVDIYLWVEVLRYSRNQAIRLSRPDLVRPINVMLYLLVVCTLPGLLMVIFFPFEEFGLYWFLHCVGAAMVFAAMAGVGFVYVTFVAPAMNMLGIVPKDDAWYRRLASIMVCVLMVIGAGVRPFHLIDPAGWSWPLLMVEVLFCLTGMLASVLGNWRTFGELDRAGINALATRSTCKED